MDPQELLNQIVARKWVGVAAIVIGIIVRLLKSDTKIPIDIPPRLRPWLAIGLGAAAGALDKLTNVDKVTWTTALLEGVTAAVVAMVSHTLVIQSALGGKELNVPGLIKENTPPGPGAPPTIPPKGPEAPPPAAPQSPVLKVVMGCALIGTFLMAGCALFTKEQAPKTAQALIDLACIAENAFLSEPALNEACGLLTSEQKAEGQKAAKGVRLGVHRAAAMGKIPGVVVARDAGADEAGARW